VLGVDAPGGDRADGDHAVLELLHERLVGAAFFWLLGLPIGPPQAQKIPNHV